MASEVNTALENFEGSPEENDKVAVMHSEEFCEVMQVSVSGNTNRDEVAWTNKAVNYLK